MNHAALLHDAPGPHPDDQACQAKPQKQIEGARALAAPQIGYWALVDYWGKICFWVKWFSGVKLVYCV